jgi:hypothetical protein
MVLLAPLEQNAYPFAQDAKLPPNKHELVVHLIQPAVHLIQPAVDSIEPFIHLGESDVQHPGLFAKAHFQCFVEIGDERVHLLHLRLKHRDPVRPWLVRHDAPALPNPCRDDATIVVEQKQSLAVGRCRFCALELRTPEQKSLLIAVSDDGIVVDMDAR